MLGCCGATLGGGGLLGLAAGLALAGAFLALAVALLAVFHELFAALEFLGGVFHFAQAVECGFDDIDRVCAAPDFGHDVLDAGEFHYGADGAAGDNAGAGLGGLEHHDRADVFGEDVVWDSAAVAGDFNDVLAGVGGAFADGVGDGVGFAHADADVTVHIAHDYHCVKAEVSAAFDDFGDSGDFDDALGELEFVLLIVAGAIIAVVSVIAWLLCSHLELQASLAGGVGEGFDAAVIAVAAAVENDCGDAFFLGALADKFAD